MGNAREQIKGQTTSSGNGTTTPPINRFFGVFGHKWNDGLTFEATPGAKASTFDKGELSGWMQIPLADVLIAVLSNGVPTGAVIPGGRVVRRVAPADQGGGSVYCFVWPSSKYGGGNVHRSFITVKNDDGAAVDFQALNEQIVSEWKKFQRDRRAKGLTNPAASMARMGVPASKDEDADLFG